MSMLKKSSCCLAAVLIFGLFPLLMSAQDASAGNKPMSVTGCLKQGTDAHGYYLTAQDGKMYEVMGKGLAEHVNHTVTVTGSQVTLSHAQEEKKEQTEKAEAGSNSYVDMRATSVKMVSTSCQ